MTKFLLPKFAAITQIVIGSILLWVLTQISSGWMLLLWLGLHLVFWWLLTRLVIRFGKSTANSHWFSLIIFLLGAMFYLLFVDWVWSWRVVGTLLVLMPSASFWLIPASDEQALVLDRQNRRVQFWLCQVGLAGIWSGAFAIPSFQIFYNASGIWWLLLATVVSTVVAAWWWKIYGVANTGHYWLWVLIWPILNFEWCYVMTRLPFGHLTAGLMQAWIFYSLWLLVRFHLSAGVDWRKQFWFLFFNIVVIIIFFTLIARWK